MYKMIFAMRKANVPKWAVMSREHRRSLILTGVATNVCVESTARDGFMLDYHSTLAKDGCAGYYPELHEAAFKNIAIWFGKALDTKEIFDYWTKSASLAS
jgi:ureidoacrylate peracid hydrolase